MSKIYRLTSFLLVFNCFVVIYGDNQSTFKVTSTTVNMPKTNTPNHQSLLNVYQPKSDVVYSEPNLDEQKSSKIDLVKKDKQLDLYKRPSQFSELIKNQPLIDKQKKAHSLMNGRINSNRVSADRSKNELNNQFSQALNYLVKYLNRQGQTRSINGTDHTKNANNILLKHARNLDRENCLLRLICEISSNQEDASDNHLVKEIRVVFSKKHQAPAYPTKRDDSFPFYYAGHIGASTGNAERCLEIFPVCSAKTDELLTIVSNANKYTASQSKLNRKSEKMMLNSKLERELYPTLESRKFSEKMHNKMKKLHKQYIKKIN